MTKKITYIEDVYLGISNRDFVKLLGSLSYQSGSTNLPFAKHEMEVDKVYYEFLASKELNTYYTSWNKANSNSLIDGNKVISINNINYNVRLLDGLDEYDYLTGINKINSCICINESEDKMNALVRRGDDKSYVSKNMEQDSYGIFAIFRTLGNSPIFNINDTNLGDILSFSSIQYSVNDKLNNNYKISHKLDGVEFFTTQSNGNSYTGEVAVPNFSDIPYGKHILVIEANNNGYKGVSTVTILFDKVKPPITTLPTTTSLKQAIAHNKEIGKEIDYQCFRLSSYLKEKDIEITEEDKKKLSILIGKVGGIELGKKWAIGKSIKNSDLKDFSRVDTPSLSKSSYIEINGLDFVPSTIIAEIGSDAFTILNNIGGDSECVTIRSVWNSTSSFIYRYKTDEYIFPSIGVVYLPVNSVAVNGNSYNWIAFE